MYYSQPPCHFAPIQGLNPIPVPLMNPLSRLVPRLPNFYMWWNRKEKDGIGPPYGYPRFATHAYAALFQSGARLVRAAQKGAPRARSIAVVTNAAEPRLDNRFTYRLIKSWRAHGAGVETYEFPQTQHLPHDLIDPGSGAQNTALVYPIITRLIEGAAS